MNETVVEDLPPETGSEDTKKKIKNEAIIT